MNWTSEVYDMENGLPFGTVYDDQGVGIVYVTLCPASVASRTRLIAAAPELMESAKDIELLYAEYLALRPNPNSEGFEMVTEAVRKSRAAVKKAEGKL